MLVPFTVLVSVLSELWLALQGLLMLHNTDNTLVNLCESFFQPCFVELLSELRQSHLAGRSDKLKIVRHTALLILHLTR